MKKLTWHAAGLTDPGLVRSENQDNFSISPDVRVFVVADGMGGTEGGALASKLAVEELANFRERTEPDLADPESLRSWLTNSIACANARVVVTAEESKKTKRMGTTIVAAVQSDDGMLHIAHVGDSRAYLVRAGKASLLTNDHSVVMEMYQRGQLTMSQLQASPYKHLITRCLGHDPDVACDYTSLNAEPGDWIILASDGLPAVMDEDEVARTIAGAEDPKQACSALVEKTLAGGAPDNVTVLVIYYQAEKTDETTGDLESSHNGLELSAKKGSPGT
jgi:PPM family protein phosphatase